MKSVAAALLASLVVAGCVAKRSAPVTERTPSPTAPSVSTAVRPPSAATVERPSTYTVKKGDTLFSIALDQGVDHRDLAAWNNIEQAKIRIGQELRLTAPSATATTAPLKSAPARVEARPLGEAGTPSPAPPVAAVPLGGNIKGEPLAVHVPYSDQAYGQLASIKPQPAIEPKPPPRPEVERGEDDLDWIWPASGRVISGFNEGANLKGIAIAGKLGQPVLASAPGRVIFSGTGIRGFGKLIVIKHNNTFLSVYAHNHTLLVKEGQTVSKGQKIAEMGNSDTDQVKLHFEIRRFGKPVDPGKLLPDRPA